MTWITGLTRVKDPCYTRLCRDLPWFPIDLPRAKTVHIKPQSMSQPDYSWAEYLDYMEGGGSDVLTLPAAAKPAAIPSIRKADQPLWGVLLAIVVTLCAIFLSELPFRPFTLPAGRHPIEPVMLAIVLGMLLSNTWALPKALHSGIKFSVKKLLPLGIVLLGARLNFSDM